MTVKDRSSMRQSFIYSCPGAGKPAPQHVQLFSFDLAFIQATQFSCSSTSPPIYHEQSAADQCPHELQFGACNNPVNEARIPTVQTPWRGLNRLRYIEAIGKCSFQFAIDYSVRIQPFAHISESLNIVKNS